MINCGKSGTYFKCCLKVTILFEVHEFEKLLTMQRMTAPVSYSPLATNELGPLFL